MAKKESHRIETIVGIFVLLGLGGAWVKVWFYDLAWYLSDHSRS